MRRLLAMIVPAALLAACGGGGGGSGQQAASDKACPQGATVVHMKDIRFQPDKASVKVGGTVCWVNDDGVQHDAVDDANAFHSALFGQGHTFSWKAAKAGTIHYVCTVHPGMTGELDVR